MTQRFHVGQSVLVIDQSPPTNGTIIREDTWGNVNGYHLNDDYCYLVDSASWVAGTRWISSENLKPID